MKNWLAIGNAKFRRRKYCSGISGWLARRSTSTNDDEQHRAQHERDDHERARPAHRRAAVERDEQRRRRRAPSSTEPAMSSLTSLAAVGLGQDEEADDQCEQRHRHLHDEDRTPPDRPRRADRRAPRRAPDRPPRRATSSRAPAPAAPRGNSLLIIASDDGPMAAPTAAPSTRNPMSDCRIPGDRGQRRRSTVTATEAEQVHRGARRGRRRACRPPDRSRRRRGSDR